MTKRERHKVYKEALVLYKKHYMALHLGLCYVLTKVSKLECYYQGMQRFPEIHKYMPKIVMDDSYWWPFRNSQKRIEVLEEAIELTKPKKR